MITNKLLLISKNDIPFVDAQISIHQPSIREIAYIGQASFYEGCNLLTFSQDSLNDQDKNHLDNLTDFEILMTILKNNNIAIKQNKVCMQLVLYLLFPQFKINFSPMSIILSKETENGLERHLIDKDNFNNFKQIIKQMFCLDQQLFNNSSKYNPGGTKAKTLVKKFRQRQQKLAKMKKSQNKKDFSLFHHYISILAVGEKKDINELLQYSVYQLFEEFNRFRKKNDFDIYIKAKMAGAKDLEEVKNWMIE